MEQLDNRYYDDLRVQAVSKQFASKHKPTKPTLLISIQDGDKFELPFKQRTNHVTRDRYVDTLFLYFDDIESSTSPFSFSENDAKQLINFLDKYFEKQNQFEQVLIHCQAGVSRSQAVALFVAKHYYKDDSLYESLLNQKGKVYGGNQLVFDTLEQTKQSKDNTMVISKIKGTTFRSESIPDFKEMADEWFGFYAKNGNERFDHWEKGCNTFLFTAHLVPEPTNPVDNRAVKVCAKKRSGELIHIGYVDIENENLKTKVYDSESATIPSTVTYGGKKSNYGFRMYEKYLKLEPKRDLADALQDLDEAQLTI